MFRDGRKNGYKGWTFWSLSDAKGHDNLSVDLGTMCTVLEVLDDWAIKCVIKEKIMFTGPIEEFVKVWHRVA